MEGGQRFQPSGLLARDGREALGPSHDGCLVPASSAGEVALGPAKDGKADQQAVAGDGERHRGRVFGLLDAIDRRWPGVFKMNTAAVRGHGFRRDAAFDPEPCRTLMPTPFDRAPVSELPGLSRPLLAFADLAHFEAPTFIVVTVVLTAVAALIVTRPRRRTAVPASVPGSGLSREEALGHVRRVKSQMKGRKGEAAVADVLARAGCLHCTTWCCGTVAA